MLKFASDSGHKLTIFFFFPTREKNQAVLRRRLSVYLLADRQNAPLELFLSLLSRNRVAWSARSSLIPS